MKGKNMKTTSFIIQKGGTGKTTSAVSVSVEIANSGKKVLLVDADPQGNSTSWLYSKPIEHELYDVLTDSCDIEQAIYKTEYENLFIIPTAGLDANLKIYSDECGGKLLKLKKVLKPLQDKFDFCIIDTSPSFGNFEKSIVYASNEIIPVLQLDQFSIEGLQIFFNNLMRYYKDLEEDTPKPNLNKIIINEINASFSQHNSLLAEIEKTFSKKYQIFTIPQDQDFKHAQTYKIAVQDVTKKPATLKALKEVAAAISGGN